MVKIEDDLRRKVERIVAAVRGETVLQRGPEEEDTLDESEVPEELLETELPGFQMTYLEMKKAVSKYSKWLSEINELIQEKGHEIRILTEEFEELTGEPREQIAFDLQIANDDYEEYQEERNEVRAKVQILRKKKAKAERKIRRQLRERDAVDWEGYDSREARERHREDRIDRQKQLQGVRAAKRDVDRETETEQPDMSAVKEVAGEEKAKKIQSSINNDIEFENEWLQDEEDKDEDEDLQELL